MTNYRPYFAALKYPRPPCWEPPSPPLTRDELLRRSPSLAWVVHQLGPLRIPDPEDRRELCGPRVTRKPKRERRQGRR